PMMNCLATVVSTQRQAAFSVTASGPHNRIFPDQQEALDKMRDGALGKFKHEKKSEVRIRLGKHHGREGVARVALAGKPGKWLRFRLYLVGDWAYILQVLGSEDTVQSEDAATFLTSFQLRPGGDAAP